MTRFNPLGQPIGDPVLQWRAPHAPARVVLRGRYCTLEPLDPARHTRDLWAANGTATDDRNWTYLMHGPYESIDDYEAWVARAASTADPLFYAVLRDSRAVGLAAYLRIAPEAGSIEVGHINFSPLLQRSPAATEAMYLMMRQAFELGYRRYEWKCDSLNAPSRSAAQRLGLSYEGIFRQAVVYKDRNRDSAWYAAIDKEWPALKAAFDHWLAPENFEDGGAQKVALSALTAKILVSRG